MLKGSNLPDLEFGERAQRVVVWSAANSGYQLRTASPKDVTPAKSRCRWRRSAPEFVWSSRNSLLRWEFWFWRECARASRVWLLKEAWRRASLRCFPVWPSVMYALYALYNRYMIRPVTLGHSDLNPLKRKVLFGDPWTLLMPCRRSRDLQSLAYRIRTRYFPPSYNTDIGCHSTRAQHGCGVGQDVDKLRSKCHRQRAVLGAAGYPERLGRGSR
jgi:hypothetical protein